MSSTPAERLARCVLKIPGCWPWIGAKTTAGYGHFYIGKQHFYAHRVALESRVGPIPPGMYACHTCDNPKCCNPDHLFVGTCKDNVADKMAKGRHVARTGDASGSRKHPERLLRGEASKSAKLTEADVKLIRFLHSQGTSGYPLLAKWFGVGKTTIEHICIRHTWRHVA